MYKLRWKVGIRSGSVEKVWRLVSLLRLISWHNKCSCVRFEEPLAMYKHRGAIRDARASRWRRSVRAFSVLLFKKPLARNAVFEKLKTVNYLNKKPSQIRLFKNKFALVRNTRNMR